MTATRRQDYCGKCGAPTNGGSLCDRCASQSGRAQGFLAHGLTFPQLITNFAVCGYLMGRWLRERPARP